MRSEAMDEARAFGRVMKAAERVRGWVAEARESAWAELAMGPPPRDLAQAQRALGRAAAKLASVDRERAMEEADIAAAAEIRERGDAALIAGLIRAALDQALGGFGAPAALAATARPGVRAVA